MNTSDPKPGERIVDVRLGDDALTVDLADGHTISVPLTWFPRLLHATPQARANWQLAGGGFGIHWQLNIECRTTARQRQTPSC
jgi:hypothetical protein